MEEPIELLSSILAQSHPHETIRLPLHQAMMIAGLDERELRSLSDAIKRVGVVRALEEEGLFARKVVVCTGAGAVFTVLKDAVRVGRRASSSRDEEFALPKC